MGSETEFGRRAVVGGMGAGLVWLLAGAPAHAGGLGLGSLLAMASDSALDRLGRPGAFYGDEAVRIGLPLLGGGGAMGDILKAGSRLGLLDGVTRKLNDAAGEAAGLAKPIFRGAIDRLTLADVPGILTEQDGASRYLRRSAGDELTGRMRPLVDNALGRSGVFREIEKISAKNKYLGLAGLGRDAIGKSVTEQGLNGIFRYMGSEEAKLRADPLGKAGKLLKGVMGN